MYLIVFYIFHSNYIQEREIIFPYYTQWDPRILTKSGLIPLMA
jgi:hypothetical protein